MRSDYVQCGAWTGFLQVRRAWRAWVQHDLVRFICKGSRWNSGPGWDFEPDTLNLKQGTILVVSDNGGEPHTFTEVKKFGGGFIDGLNAREETVPECKGGFTNVGVAKTRIVQGSHTNITDLSKGEHLFQGCIHSWMRVRVDVK